jgi:small ligand-binding sensory domain FIST
MVDMAPGGLEEARCAVALRRGLETSVPEAVRAALDDLGAPAMLAIIEVSAPGEPLAAGRALAHASALIAEESPGCVVVGSNAHGVIGPDGSVEMQPAVAVWLAHLPGTRPRGFRLATVPAPHGGLALTGLPDIDDDDRLALLLADPWTLPADEVVAAFSRVDGPLPVVGGLVSGGQRRGDSRLLLDGAVFDNGGVGVVLDANAPVRVVVSQGCRPIGDAMTVTASAGTTVSQLAGRPALERIRDVVSGLDDGDQALAVRGLHVGIARDDRSDGAHAADYVVRGILGVDAATGAVTVGDDVPVGAVVRLHLRDADSAESDLESVMGFVRDAENPAGAYLVTCNGRGGAMFTTSDHDAAIVRARLGTSSVGGFFAAGEIGPVGGANHLHGFTAVILVVDRTSSPTSPPEIRRPVSSESDVDTDLFDAALRSLLDPP